MKSAAQDRERIPWSDRFAIWRMNWFPYRTYELLDGGQLGPAKWEWPDRLYGWWLHLTGRV